MPVPSVYRRPVETYEVTDAPEAGFDPVGKVFRLVFIFAVIQGINLLATIAIWLR